MGAQAAQAYSTGRGFTRGRRIAGGLQEVHRCLRCRRFSTSNLETLSQSRADLGPAEHPRALARPASFDARSLRQATRALRQARPSSRLHTRWGAKCATALAAERPQTPRVK